VFNGRIAIAVGADRSDAQLRTASLLLSEQAEIDVKPELEIYADEVSASHGATVGQLDERALFYLRSRGIGLDDARRMLTEAFLRDLFDAVPEGAARLLIEQALALALPKLDEIAA
jgi:Fe-S cluster assembly protein SufD